MLKQAMKIYIFYICRKKDEEDLESLTYNEIEMNIYEDGATFRLSTDYSQKYSVKKKDEGTFCSNLSVFFLCSFGRSLKTFRTLPLELENN